MFEYFYSLIVSLFERYRSQSESRDQLNAGHLESNASLAQAEETKVDPTEVGAQIMSIDAKLIADAEARLEVNRSDAHCEPEQIELLDDPDPFGMDWKWLDPDR